MMGKDIYSLENVFQRGYKNKIKQRKRTTLWNKMQYSTA